MLRKHSVLDILLFTSLFVLLFLFVLFANLRLRSVFDGVERDLVHEARERYGLELRFTRLGLASFRSLRIHGLEIRGAGDGLLLATAERFEIGFDVIGLLFSGRPLLENLSRVQLEKPVFYQRGSDSLVSRLQSPEGGAVSLEALELSVSIQHGEWRLQRRVAGRTNESTSVLVAVDNGTLDFMRGAGQFRLEGSASLLPASSVARTAFRVGGELFPDPTGFSLDAVFRRTVIAGTLLPELRVVMRADEEGIVLASQPAGQAVTVEGRIDPSGTGEMRFALGDDRRAFMDFISQNFHDPSGMFFLPGVSYQPAGAVALSLRPDGMRILGNLEIREQGGGVVFALDCSGDADRLEIRRLVLQRGVHLASFSGSWRFRDDLPTLNGQLANLRFGDTVFSGTVSLSPTGADSYRAVLGSVQVNRAAAGNYQGIFSFSEAGLGFSINDGSGALRASGSIVSPEEWETEIVLRGYAPEGFTRLAGLGGILDGRRLTGELRLRRSLRFSGEVALQAVSTVASFDRIVLDARLEDEVLAIERFENPAYGIAVSGELRPESDGYIAALALRYAGREYPLPGRLLHLRRGQEFRLAADGLFRFAGVLDGEGGVSRFSLELEAFPMASLGLESEVSGRLDYVDGPEGASGSGNLDLVGTGSLAAWLPRGQLNLVFDRRGFELRQLRIQNAAGGVTGNGRVQFEDDGWRGQLQLGNNATISLARKGGRVRGEGRFTGFQLASLFGTQLQGILEGDLVVDGPEADPELAVRLAVRNGQFGGEAFAGVLSLAGPFSDLAVARGGRIEWGGWRGVVGQGNFRVGGGERMLSLQMDIRHDDEPLAVSARLELSGGLLRAGGFDGQLALRDLLVNGRPVAHFATRAQVVDGMAQLLRRGPSGVTGFIQPRTGNYSLKFYKDNQPLAELSRIREGRTATIHVNADRLPLDVLALFPGLVRRGDGFARVRLSLQGPANDRQLVGFLRVDKGLLDLTFLREPLRNLDADLLFDGKRLEVRRFSGTVAGGSLTIAGGAFIREGRVEDLDLRVRSDISRGIEVDVDTPNFKTRGRLLFDVFLRGNPRAPDLGGRLAMVNNDFMFLPDTSAGESDSILNQINWNLEITALEGVNYTHNLFNVVLRPQSRISLRNRIADRDFQVSGRIEALQGTVDYVNQEFRVEQPTVVEFRRTGSSYDPWLTARGRLRLRDENLEDVTIRMEVDQSLRDAIIPRFSSEPPRSDEELRVLLGIDATTVEAVDGRTGTSVLMRSTDLLSTLGFKMFINRYVRQTLGLDMFSVRTPLVRNIYEQGTADALDPRKQLSIWRDTQFSMGKYLTGFIFAEYTLTLKESLGNTGTIIYAHQIGLELSFDFINLGYLIKPVEKSGIDEYEHSVELRFRRTF